MGVIQKGFGVLSRYGPRTFLADLVMFLGRRTARWIRPASTDERLRDIADVLDIESPVIVDGGGHKGESITTYLVYFPAAEIHSIEANPATAATLVDRFGGDDRIEIHNVALGPDADEVTFNVTENSALSSTLSPGDNLADQSITVQEQVPVEQRPLDDLLSKRVDVLQLSLQGYELAAIEGSQKTLKEVKIVTLPYLEFIEMYEAAAMFCEIDDFLRKHGFALHGLYDFSKDDSGALIHAGAVYVNSTVAGQSDGGGS